MDGDIDMDAPQISTLRDEATSPASSPTGSNSSRLRVKLVMNSNGKNKESPPAASVPVKRARSDDGEEEDDQEDQLIDDDDGDAAASVSAPAETAPAATPKKKAPVKRKSKKTDVKEEDSTGFDPNHISLTVAPTESVSAPPAKRKKVEKVPKASVSAAPRTVKSRVTKAKTIVSQLAADDSGALSEAFTGTAASSPVTLPSPEPESVVPPEVPLDEEKEINLENVPIPVYALPTKPFPVQQAPKATAGYAPIIPLDRSGKKVRKWRVANREIRGIAGGRWLTRSWVGEKHSEYAGSKGSKGTSADSQLAIPRLPSLLGKTKPKAAKSSPLTASSRSESVAADAPPPAVRNLTKMRTTMLGPSSEAGDSDLMN